MTITVNYYSGDSLIINPQGEELARAEPGSAMIIDAELSLEALQDYRETFPRGAMPIPFCFMIA